METFSVQRYIRDSIIDFIKENQEQIFPDEYKDAIVSYTYPKEEVKHNAILVRNPTYHKEPVGLGFSFGSYNNHLYRIPFSIVIVIRGANQIEVEELSDIVEYILGLKSFFAKMYERAIVIDINKGITKGEISTIPVPGASDIYYYLCNLSLYGEIFIKESVLYEEPEIIKDFIIQTNI